MRCCHITIGDGVIGISFVPSVRHIGGVCEKHREYVRSIVPSGKYTFNTVLISQLTRGRRLVDGIAALTVSHEIGHSFGSDHDDSYPEYSACFPGADSAHGL